MSDASFTLSSTSFSKRTHSLFNNTTILSSKRAYFAPIFPKFVWPSLVGFSDWPIEELISPIIALSSISTETSFPVSRYNSPFTIIIGLLSKIITSFDLGLVINPIVNIIITIEATIKIHNAGFL